MRGYISLSEKVSAELCGILGVPGRKGEAWKDFQSDTSSRFKGGVKLPVIPIRHMTTADYAYPDFDLHLICWLCQAEIPLIA